MCGGGHGGDSFHYAKGNGDGNGAGGVVTHVASKFSGMGAFPHTLYVLGRGVHFSAECYRVLVVHAAYKFDRCGSVKR